ncbi:MAG: hypothetical protein IKD37_05265 [Clostridia bacterium]|nr:hypothetical protein [Clostridia bacterium]
MEEKKNNVAFSTALNGYKKQDVNQFIAMLNAKFSAAEEDYRREIASLKKQLEACSGTQAHDDAAEAELLALRHEVEELREKLAASTVCETAAADMEAMRKELEGLRKKALLYDQMSLQLGDMMISANHNADKIIAHARKDAEQSLANVKSNIAQSANTLSGKLDTLYRNTNTRVMSEISTAMQQTQRTMSVFLEELSSRCAQIELMLKQSDADTRRIADEQISSMLNQTQDAIAAIGAKPIDGQERRA